MREESKRGLESRKAFVLDTAALLLGFTGEESLYTTTAAVKEVKHGELQVTRLEAMIDSGVIKVAEPSIESIERAKKLAQKTDAKLSHADLTVLAVALDLKKIFGEVTIVTDDYSLQNLATRLELRYIPLKLPGIRKKGFKHQK